jgi:GT2 family glycosyltransferase
LDVNIQNDNKLTQEVNVNSNMANMANMVSQVTKAVNQAIVTVIIVNWNSCDFLEETVTSLYSYTSDINYEIIILDNNSKPDNESYKFLKKIENSSPDIKVIFNNDNPGFAKANNTGIDMSSSKYVLLLNPDVLLKSNIVKILSDYMDENTEVGMAGPKVLNPDESFQSPCMRGEPNPLDVIFYLSGMGAKYNKSAKFNKFSLNHLDKDKIHHVVGLSGCCMMVRRELIEDVGKMDEQFFLYQEETDWCLRAYKAGYKIAYNPNAVIIHEKGATTRQKALKNNYIFCSSMMKFFKKHYFKNYNFLQKACFAILIWGNFFVRYFKIIQTSFKRNGH